MFKDKIKIIREKHNLTQEEFAGKIFVSRTAVSKWETVRGIRAWMRSNRFLLYLM